MKNINFESFITRDSIYRQKFSRKHERQNAGFFVEICGDPSENALNTQKIQQKFS